MKYTLHHNDCITEMRDMPGEYFDSVVTDPPYELNFMGKSWDRTGIAANSDVWSEVVRVLKPGGHVAAFGGTRTVHRMACAIEDAGFAIRDGVMWLYGSGFPKSPHSLKPGYEPIVLARKPMLGTVAENRRVFGCGGLNIDACRVVGTFQKSGWSVTGSPVGSENRAMAGPNYARAPKPDHASGRWPANVIHDGSDEVAEAFAAFGRQTGGKPPGPEGSASRFFYCAKAGSADRAGSEHPTVKPLALMRWLCNLITPPGGHILDPFAGSGTTLEAARSAGFHATGIEREAEYVADIRRRMAGAERTKQET